MKRYALAGAALLLLSASLWMVGATTFSWSIPGQKGILTYTGVRLDTPEIGHDTDTTLSRASAGVLAVEGNAVYAAGGTDIPVADGGSGASTFTTNGVLLGSTAAAIRATAEGADNTVLVGNTGAAPSFRTVVNADINASAAIAQSKMATAGLGAGVTSTSTITEVASPLVETVITMSDIALVATDTSDEGEGTKIFDADDGAFFVSLSVANMSCITTDGATNFFYMGCGTAKAGDDATLTGTEVDIIPSTTLDTTGGTVKTNAFDAILATAAIFDGTGTAKDIYLNFAIADTNMNANVTNTISGTLTIITTRPVDN